MVCFAVLVASLPPAETGATDEDQAGDAATEKVAATRAIRPVRVLIARSISRFRVRSRHGLRLQTSDGREEVAAAPDAWVVATAKHDGIRLGSRRCREPFRILSNDRAPLSLSLYHEGNWTEPQDYPGVFQVIFEEDQPPAIINEVDIEPYVACVTANEVWPAFQQETFLVQSIVARTYAIYQMQRRNRAAYDLSATQGSQVYRGWRHDTTGRKAAQAAERTRGLVLTWFDGTRDRVFCAYYCAACGGRTQSAAIFGPEGDIEPLSGGVVCNYCRIAPGQTYRWGPVRLSLREIYRRLSSRYARIRALESLHTITIVEATDDGRAKTIRLTGVNGRREDMLAERFRLAVGASVLRSTHFSIRRTGDVVIFEDGRGFGHGLGLCQWGAEGQARLGRRAGAILRYYYPGAKLTRIY